jgi:uncharacterized protein
MAQLGKINQLEIVRRVDFGVYLNGGKLGEILMPKRYVTPQNEIGDIVEVIVYLDGEERYVATTDKPYAQVGDFAYLKVNKIENVGAFCDWGVLKELLVPFSEQKVKMEEGKSYLVYLYVDQLTQRITGTMKIDKYVLKEGHGYKVNDPVDLIIWTQTDIGWKAIVDQKYLGVLYKNEVHQRISNGQKISGFIKKVREDGKIDLTLVKQGFEKFDEITTKILAILDKAGGKLPYTDKSDPDVISRIFGVSKKAFKQSIGQLYKQRVIALTETGIHRVNEGEITESA